MHVVKNYAIIACNGHPTRSADSNYNDCNHFISNRFKWNKTFFKTIWGKTFYIKPTDSREFCLKRRSEAIGPVLCSLSGYRELNLTTNLFAGHILCSLLTEVLNIY